METSKTQNNFVTYTNPHPGGVLLSELEAREISVENFSKHSGIDLSVLYDIINKRMSITSDVAQKLESALGIEAGFWLDYQHGYDTWPERRAAYEAAHPEVPRSKELQKIQKSHKPATVEIENQKDWLSVLDVIKKFVHSKGLGETPRLTLTFDAQPV